MHTRTLLKFSTTITHTAGNLILDVHGLRITDPLSMEAALDGIAGVVTNGVFARRPADILLLGTSTGVQSFERR
jgi:ribose 5-phosphate isomerase A